MTQSDTKIEAEAVRVLWEEIGTYSVQCAKTGELAPSSSLVDAVDTLAAFARSQQDAQREPLSFTVADGMLIDDFGRRNATDAEIELWNALAARATRRVPPIERRAAIDIVDCPACDGVGYFEGIGDRCTECSGTGNVSRRHGHGGAIIPILPAPAKIFLVIGEDCPEGARWDQLAEVTWCEDNIDGNGIEYVKAVDADYQLGALRAERDAALAQIEKLTKEQRKLTFGIGAWKEIFWVVARELNCLPSTFWDGNAHVLRAAIKLNAELVALKADRDALLERGAILGNAALDKVFSQGVDALLTKLEGKHGPQA